MDGFESAHDALREGTDLIALSTTWLPIAGGSDLLRDTARRLRSLSPGVPIVAGGAGVEKGLKIRKLILRGEMNANQLEHDYLLINSKYDQAFDGIILGQNSEATLLQVIEQVAEGKDLADIANLAIPGDNDYVFTEQVDLEVDINAELVDWSRYHQDIGPFEVPIRTGIGCPFKCQFCDFTGLYRNRLRSVNSLLAELKTLIGCFPAPRKVFFADDNLAYSRKRLRELLKGIIEAKLDLSWRSFIRADVIDEETADLLRESGCRECLLGIESGSPVILQNMVKQLDPEKALKTIHHLDRNGISTQTTFVVGFPGEDSNTIEETVQFISSYPSDAIHRYYLFPLIVFPLSPVSTPDNRAKWKLQGVGFQWSHLTMTSADALDAVKDIFLQVRGPSHVYPELLPADWPKDAIRRVLILRDDLRRQELTGRNGSMRETLLQAVASANSFQ